MSRFNLEISTPDKVILNSQVQKIIVRTIEGDIGILKNHANYISVIDNGPITIFYLDGTIEKAKIENGFIFVRENEVLIMTLKYKKLKI